MPALISATVTNYEPLLGFSHSGFVKLGIKEALVSVVFLDMQYFLMFYRRVAGHGLGNIYNM